MSIIQELAELLATNDEAKELWDEMYREDQFTYYEDGPSEKFQNKFGFETNHKSSNRTIQETYSIIISVKKYGQEAFARLDGWYASFYGAEIDNIFAIRETKQAEKTITYWT